MDDTAGEQWGAASCKISPYPENKVTRGGGYQPRYPDILNETAPYSSRPTMDSTESPKQRLTRGAPAVIDFPQGGTDGLTKKEVMECYRCYWVVER